MIPNIDPRRKFEEAGDAEGGVNFRDPSPIDLNIDGGLDLAAWWEVQLPLSQISVNDKQNLFRGVPNIAF